MMSVSGSSVPVPVPYASVGIMEIDHQGRYTSYGKISVGGQVQDFQLPGSMQVNPDCTATDTYGSFQLADRWVILDHGNEMEGMPTKHPLGPVAGTFRFRRISWGEPQCTTDMVRGLYGGTAEGTVMMPVPGQTQPAPIPFSTIFATTLQHGGTGTAVSTGSLGGNVFDLEIPTVSIQVNPDCTATGQWTAPSKQVPGQTLARTVMYIILDRGNELIGLETKDSLAPSIAIENHKRISIVPVTADR
jgi:hypothetical protein